VCAHTLTFKKESLVLQAIRAGKLGFIGTSSARRKLSAHLAALSLSKAVLVALERAFTAWPIAVLYEASVRRKLRRDILGESNTGSNRCSVSKASASEE
jgi:hypothetical protein